MKMVNGRDGVIEKKEPNIERKVFKKTHIMEYRCRESERARYSEGDDGERWV